MISPSNSQSSKTAVTPIFPPYSITTFEALFLLNSLPSLNVSCQYSAVCFGKTTRYPKTQISFCLQFLPSNSFYQPLSLSFLPHSPRYLSHLNLFFIPLLFAYSIRAVFIHLHSPINGAVSRRKFLKISPHIGSGSPRTQLSASVPLSQSYGNKSVAPCPEPDHHFAGFFIL